MKRKFNIVLILLTLGLAAFTATGCSGSKANPAPTPQVAAGPDHILLIFVDNSGQIYNVQNTLTPAPGKMSGPEVKTKNFSGPAYIVTDGQDGRAIVKLYRFGTHPYKVYDNVPENDDPFFRKAFKHDVIDVGPETQYNYKTKRTEILMGTFFANVFGEADGVCATNQLPVDVVILSDAAADDKDAAIEAATRLATKSNLRRVVVLPVLIGEARTIADAIMLPFGAKGKVYGPTDWQSDLENFGKL